MPARTHTILLAEDDGPLSTVLAGRLRSLGQKIMLSRDAAHTLFLMHREPPDLAIMDVQMPAGNGLAVCEMMRDDARLREVPVILITGLDDVQVRERAHSLNARYILKTSGLWAQIEAMCIEILHLGTKPVDNAAGHPSASTNRGAA